ncbi:MAG: hypothetical protein EP332_10465 [Bacteroidetes bacterium]|nr:MAG: hypothetical protein EP332_10465 [Bacteroidota bacterium]
MNVTLRYFFFISFGFALFITSCRKDGLYESSDAVLQISEDTVYFDTVFTQLGGGPEPRSVNKRIVVRNPYSQSIKTRIRIEGGNESPWRINVDGIPTSDTEYEILPEDSIYIFIELSAKPNPIAGPFFVTDRILFATNGNQQDVDLVTWGVDAHYFRADTIDCSLGDVVWNDVVKPYVIYDYLFVPPGCKLIIEEGVKVHSAVGGYFIVGGTMEVRGTKENPVVFQGARLESAYQNTASQWIGIRFFPSSTNNIMRYAEVKNAIIGVEVDSLQAGNGTKLQIDNCIIKNMSAAGLVGYTARIRGTNTLVANCGQYTFIGELGGDYSFRHCTFATYNTTFVHTKPSFGLSNADYEDINGNVISNDLAYNIQNCIIYGSLDEEMVFFEGGGGNIQPRTIQNCILKTEMGNLNTNDNILNRDPRFKNYRELNFELDTLSPAIDAGALLFPVVNIDLTGEPRDLSPDIGAYERKE